MVWWLVAEHDGRPFRVYPSEEVAQEYVDTWSDGRGWRVIRVIESPGGRGRKKARRG